MTTNDEVINKMKHSKLTIAQQLPIMLNKARGEGYKEGQKDTAKYIFKELDEYLDVAITDCQRVFAIHRHTYEALKKRVKVE